MRLLLIPVLAAMTQAASLLYAKVALTRRRISVRDYIPGLFLFLALFSLIVQPVLGGFDYTGFMASGSFVKFLLAIAAAMVWNVCYYLGLRKEKANTSEGIMILMPLATIAMAWLFDWSQFNLQIAVVTALATAVVIWAYSNQRVFVFDKYAFLLGVAVVFTALENVLAAQILQQGFIAPATFYFIRTLLLFGVFYLYYRPHLKQVSRSNIRVLSLSAIIGTTMMLLRFYGLKDAGIEVTAIILILSPALVLIFASRFLHERIKPKRVVGMVAVLGMIIYAIGIISSNI